MNCFLAYFFRLSGETSCDFFHHSLKMAIAFIELAPSRNIPISCLLEKAVLVRFAEVIKQALSVMNILACNPAKCRIVPVSLNNWMVSELKRVNSFVSVRSRTERLEFPIQFFPIILRTDLSPPIYGTAIQSRSLMLSELLRSSFTKSS